MNNHLQRVLLLCSVTGMMATGDGFSQSADWQNVIWREPQVRYLLADMTLGGDTKLYRNYAKAERDPDSREAIRLWDAGARVVNKDEFERKWVANEFGKDGRVMRIVQRGSNRTITGREILLTSDLIFQDGAVREALLHFALGKPLPASEGRIPDANMREAIRRWEAGARVLNTNWFEMRGADSKRTAYYKGTDFLAEGAHIRLNSDLAYPEVNARYFLADIYLGGSREFYHRAAEAAHEMGCQEAVARFDSGVKIINIHQFERKKVGDKMLITRKGSDERISGTQINLSTDVQP